MCKVEVGALASRSTVSVDVKQKWTNCLSSKLKSREKKEAAFWAPRPEWSVWSLWP